MSFRKKSRSFPDKRLPLDRLVLSLMAGLLLLMFLLISLGDHAIARVQEFSWQERTVGSENSAFVITFNRPVDHESVENSLKVKPDLPGRISWAGRRMAYTLDIPIPYGETYEVEVTEIRDRFTDNAADTQFETFTGIFESRDRAIAYIGNQGEEKGRLVLINFSQQNDPVILTPPDLTVLDFEPYPLGDRLFFSAIPTSNSQAGEINPALYTVATGLVPNPPEDWQVTQESFSIAPSEAGNLVPVLVDDTYQNLAFDLSPDGRIVVVQRVNQSDPEDFGPWILREGKEPKTLNIEPGGEFLIGPDSQTLLMLQGQGTAVIPIETRSENENTDIEPIDFLPEFGRVFDINHDGTAAAMVNFNQNNPQRRFTETLVVVTSQGEEIELLNVTGAILDAQFDRTSRIVYVLASNLLPGDTYQEQPFLAAVNLEDREPIKLLDFPQSRVSMSISPDGLAALVGVEVPNESSSELSAQTILLPLFDTTQERLSGTPTQTTPQVLPYSGLFPTWLP